MARGLLGLGGNALKKEIEFKPNFPGTWDRVEIKNFRLGKENFYIGMERGKKKLTFRIKSHLKIPYRLFLCPSLGYGTQIESVRVNGIDKDFNIENEKGEVRCCLFLEIEDLAEIEIEYGEGIFLHRQPRFPQVGDKTTDLKIVRVQYMDNQMEILTEGLGGKTYFLSLVTPRTILSYNGAKIHDEENLKKKLILSFEEAKSGYSRKEILIKFK